MGEGVQFFFNVLFGGTQIKKVETPWNRVLPKELNLVKKLMDLRLMRGIRRMRKQGTVCEFQ